MKLTRTTWTVSFTVHRKQTIVGYEFLFIHNSFVPFRYLRSKRANKKNE